MNNNSVLVIGMAIGLALGTRILGPLLYMELGVRGDKVLLERGVVQYNSSTGEIEWVDDELPSNSQ